MIEVQVELLFIVYSIMHKAQNRPYLLIVLRILCISDGLSPVLTVPVKLPCSPQFDKWMNRDELG